MAFLGYIYEAYDSVLRMNVALKMEKKDKSKNILKFEYQVLQHLKGKIALQCARYWQIQSDFCLLSLLLRDSKLITILSAKLLIGI